MNILITGNLSLLARAFANEFMKQRHRVVLAADHADLLDIKSKGTIVHSIDPARDIFREAMSSYGFDSVVFMATREEQLDEQSGLNTGHQLDGLRNTLELCRHGNLKHFFYISSTEVYGNMENGLENAEPAPASINGHILVTGEQYCRHYQYEHGLNVTIVRLPYVYGSEEKAGFLYRLIQDCRGQKAVLLPGDADRPCNFLHAGDVTEFLKRAIDEEYSPTAQVINLSSSVTVTNLQISQILHKYFPKTSFSFDDSKRAFTRPAVTATAKNVFDWIDLHDLHTEIARYPELSEESHALRKTTSQEFLKRFPGIVELLKPVELVLGAFVTQFLSQLTGTLIQYKYVDFRLLFVVVMGSVYGLRYGMLAAFLMSLSLIYTWYQLEIDWSLLIYNVGNWFPPVLYFVTGLIIGYNRDRNETIIDNEKNQTKLIYEKYEFLYGVFNEVRKLKDEFRQQVISYRDSFGKIYTITRELDTLQEQDVYLKALNILEELMENDSIAIYSLEPDREYARLEVSSTSLYHKLAKSLRLSNYPEAVKNIEEGTIFQNTQLLPNYPAYIAPIFNNSYPFNVPVAIIVIWSVKFESYSIYYYNLFKVICGLIQASLVRATKFLDANYERTYIPATRILNPEAFTTILRTRAEMNKNKVAVDQLVMIERVGVTFQELDSKVSRGIRAGDIVGIRPDGHCYILLSQADRQAAKEVAARLEKLGLHCKLLDAQEMLLEEWQLVA
ncbi:MAG TPA: NAD-dependent epimerase/dehydratase family protein [Anaerolineales bacterium]|nr:NAD-dependent epimerase/dehydratase family protein [Anaerolineales bacterium]